MDKDNKPVYKGVDSPDDKTGKPVPADKDGNAGTDMSQAAPFTVDIPTER